MKKRIIWLLVSCLMVISLVLASCASVPSEEGKPAPPTEEKPAAPAKEKPVEEEKVAEVDMVQVKLTKPDGTIVEKMVEKPKYGGVFRQVFPYSPRVFDELFGGIWTAHTLTLTNEALIIGDWAQGPAGTGEVGWLLQISPAPPVQAGACAESWELTDPSTLVLHIRKGVHFHNKPPVNGREMTADDVVFSIERLFKSKTAYHGAVMPWDTYIESVTAPDKWTVVIKSKVQAKTGRLHELTIHLTRIVPREMVEKYGDMGKWENSCGTGQFMLVDHVNGASSTLERNPNYWGKDPVHPKNQLPYLDGVKLVVIPDLSTQLAAMRTAKIDWIGGVERKIEWEDAGSLMKTNPELKYIGFFCGGTMAIHVRVDKPDLPIYDKKVRHALAMAIDNEELRDTYYGGNAELVTWPAGPVPPLKDVHIPLGELPQSTRELYEYHPDKAKQLLAEAGYPNGFKTEIITTAPHADLLSVVKAYWEKIGVDLKLDVREYAVYNSIGAKKTHNQMYMAATNAAIPFSFCHSEGGVRLNFSMMDDPKINEACRAVGGAYFDYAKRNQLMREVVPYMLDQCYIIPLPGRAIYNFWQPWVKGFHGELIVGYACRYDFVKYVWIDQDLREEMTGRR